MTLCTSANASTILLNIVYPSGIAGTQWQFFATDSLGNNAGIYGVGFDILGATSFLFEAPVATFDNGSRMRQFGFTAQLFGTST